MKLGLVLLVVVGMTHLAYLPLSSDAQAASWGFYILRGYEGALLYAVIFVYLRTLPLVGIACIWGFTEELETAVCAMAGTINVPFGSSVCVEHYGKTPYLATMALTLVYFWNIRHGRKDRSR